MQAASDSNPLELPGHALLKTASFRWARHTISFRGERRASAGVARASLLHCSLARTATTTRKSRRQGSSRGPSATIVPKWARIPRQLIEVVEGRHLAWRPAPGHLWARELEPPSPTRIPVTHMHDWTKLSGSLSDASRSGDHSREATGQPPPSDLRLWRRSTGCKDALDCRVRWFPLRPWLSGPVGHEGLSHTVHLRCPISSGVSAA
jgi:hypothetical protein